MQRSRVNQILASADEFIRSFGFRLPPFADLSPDQMRARRHDLNHVVGARLGWDITDFGLGRFDETGLVLFTLRNGRLDDLKRGRGMCYAEKLLISRRDQRCPMHSHVIKAEDIINRGGATLAVELYGSDDKGELDPDASGEVMRDGIRRRYTPGEVILLAPGESVTLMPGDWHAFRGEGGDVLIGEVSTVNDDLTDNRFVEPLGRFSEIDEDVAPLALLVSDYDRWL